MFSLLIRLFWNYFCALLSHSLDGNPFRLIGLFFAGNRSDPDFDLQGIQRAIFLALLNNVDLRCLYPSFGCIFEELIRLFFFTEILLNMSLTGSHKSLTSLCASPLRQAERARSGNPSQPLLPKYSGTGRTYLSCMDPCTRDSFLKTLASLRGTKDEEEYACEALGVLSENLENVKERIDPRLTPDSPCNVEIQGIPIACDIMELAELLHRFDGGIVPANLARITRILPPLQHVWPKDSREPVITKTAKLENFHVSPSLFSFLKTAGRHSDLPVDLFLQDDSPFVHAVEIPVTAELRGFIKLLESLNWSKWQIEGYLRKLVESAILSSGKNVSVVGLRMLVIKQATSSAAGGRRVPCRHLCSECRIVVFLDDAPSVAALAQRLRGLTIELHPLPNITVSFTPWQHSQVTKSLTSIWMIKKEAEARLKASECVPPRPILSRVEVRFKVIVNPMANIRKSLESMEQIFSSRSWEH